MILRIAIAYGALYSLCGSLTAMLMGVLIGHHVLGVTRQPLPLTWPACVVFVVTVQLPLKEIFGSFERMAERATQARLLRSGVLGMFVAAAVAANHLTNADPALQIFMFLLIAVGFTATALTQMDSWVWTLSIGMTWIGLQFVTPMGQRMPPILNGIGFLGAAALALSAVVLYVMTASSSRVRFPFLGVSANGADGKGH